MVVSLLNTELDTALLSVIVTICQYRLFIKPFIKNKIYYPPIKLVYPTPIRLNIDIRYRQGRSMI